MILLRRALADKNKGLGLLPVDMDENALRFLSTISDGDGRRALNALEVAVLTTPKSKMDVSTSPLLLRKNPSRKTSQL